MIRISGLVKPLSMVLKTAGAKLNTAGDTTNKAHTAATSKPHTNATVVRAKMPACLGDVLNLSTVPTAEGVTNVI